MAEDPSVTYLDRLRLLVLDDDFISQRFRNLVNDDYKRLVERNKALEAEKDKMVAEIEDLRAVNERLMTAQMKARELEAAEKEKYVELFQTFRSLQEENVMLQLQISRLQQVSSSGTLRRSPHHHEEKATTPLQVRMTRGPGRDRRRKPKAKASYRQRTWKGQF